MNSNISAPTVTYGAFEIKNLTGGEINWDTIVPTTVEGTPSELFYKLPSHEIRREVERCKKELRESPSIYSIENGVVRRNPIQEEKTITLRERVTVGYDILNRRSYNRIRKLKVSEIGIYEIESINSPMNRGIFKDYNYEVIKGDKMMKNEIHVEIKEDMDLNKYEDITKDCLAPYTRGRVGIKKKDFLILHRSGRLGLKSESGAIYSTLVNNIPDDDDKLQEIFKDCLNSGREFFVLLPKGGYKKKEYGSVPLPSPWSDYTRKHNIAVPVDTVIRKVYNLNLDGKTSKSKEVINSYRGSTEGYGPVYEYDEDNHSMNFAPETLSFNHIEYGEKFVIVIGTLKSIKKIDSRIKNGNSVKNGYYNFTDQKIVGYNGQTSRCKNKRVALKKDGSGVGVIGLNLKGTPEENLKSYLRSFDKVPKQRNNKEVKELIEIAHEQDGRQSRLNIEHDLRKELRHLKSRSSKELYYLLLEVEEEISYLPGVTFLSYLPGYVEEMGSEIYFGKLKLLQTNTGKKEEALVEVIKSFKSSKEIAEHEGKGLTSDIDDLVTIEENADDSSYKKSKNLFSQQLGILNRNQNPLRMEGGFSFLSDWKIKGGPISIPSSKPLPKRNIRFVQRNTTKRVPIPLGTMFTREFGVKMKRNGGIKVERVQPLSHSSLKEERKTSWKSISIRIPHYKGYPIYQKKPEEKSADTRTLFKCFNEKSEELLEKAFEYRQRHTLPDFISKNMKVTTSQPRCRPKTMRKNVRNLIFLNNGTMFLRQFYSYEDRFCRNKVEVESCGLKGNTWVKISKKDTIKNLGSKSTKGIKRYMKNNHCVSIVRLFDDRNNPGESWKQVTLEQFLASEQKPYQFSGKKVFDEEKHEYVRVPLTTPSSFQILHTIGDGKGNIDHYIISINGLTLYAKGNIELLNKSSISFTGTRKPSNITKKFVKGVVNMFLKEDDYVTISGGAEGCDTLVHSTTISKGGKTVIVLAGGFDGQYTKKNQIKTELVLKHGGLLLSEHPPEYVPSKKDFVLRNRVIASLSDKLVVFEAGSGTKHCARFGAELGKELLIQTRANNQIKLVSRRDYPF